MGFYDNRGETILFCIVFYCFFGGGPVFFPGRNGLRGRRQRRLNIQGVQRIFRTCNIMHDESRREGRHLGSRRQPGQISYRLHPARFFSLFEEKLSLLGAKTSTAPGKCRDLHSDEACKTSDFC